MDAISSFFQNLQKASNVKQRTSSALQLHKFSKAWNYLHRDHFLENQIPDIPVSRTDIPANLKLFVDILVQEHFASKPPKEGRTTLPTSPQQSTSTSAPPCLEFLYRHNCLQILVNISEPDYPTGFRKEIIVSFATLVRQMGYHFLTHNRVHIAMIKLLESCVHDERFSEVYQDEIVELMYNVVEKITQHPELLSIFFQDKSRLKSPIGSESELSDDKEQSKTLNEGLSEGDTKEPSYEFTLFTYLLRFVHKEGNSGDIARSGLLSLLEIANGPLREFILESEFPSVIAASLCALYSQLPRQLPQTKPYSTNMSADDTLPLPSPSIPTPELDSFLKLVNFSQQAISRSPSTSINLSLLSHIKVIFLDNIVYTSLVSSSDTVSAAEISTFYLDQTLQVLSSDNIAGNPLARVFIEFLLATEAKETVSNDGTITNQKLLEVEEYFERRASLKSVPAPKIPSSVDLQQLLSKATISRGNSIASLNNLDLNVQRTVQLKDVLMQRLRTVVTTDWTQGDSVSTLLSLSVATLKLFNTILTQHWQFAVPLLVPAIATDFVVNSPTTDIFSGININIDAAAHLRERKRFSDLVSRFISILPSSSSSPDKKKSDSKEYTSYLKDAESSIFKSSAFSGGLVPQVANISPSDSVESIPSTPMTAPPSSNIPEFSKEPFIYLIFSFYNNFFRNPPELNLLLTGIMAGLAKTPDQRLYNWLYHGDIGSSAEGDLYETPLGNKVSMPLYPLLKHLLGIVRRLNVNMTKVREIEWADSNRMILVESVKELTAILAVHGLVNDVVAFA
ncbi:Retinoic acid induced 16-like protein-domain-containing protein [Paraphysoderma sedebokerense]|nr:Retinoic acid induced 16-like protein-domain-containing protein [Paraphysoderma sedebokerense]